MSTKFKSKKAKTREDNRILNGNAVKQASSNARTLRCGVYSLENVSRNKESAARQIEKNIPLLAETAMKRLIVMLWHREVTSLSPKLAI